MGGILSICESPESENVTKPTSTKWRVADSGKFQFRVSDPFKNLSFFLKQVLSSFF